MTERLIIDGRISARCFRGPVTFGLVSKFEHRTRDASTLRMCITPFEKYGSYYRRRVPYIQNAAWYADGGN